MNYENLKTKTIKVSYENIEDALVAYFTSLGEIHEDDLILLFDLPVALNEEGLVEIDMEYYSAEDLDKDASFDPE